MKIDADGLKELLKAVFLKSSDNSKEAIIKGLEEIENITIQTDGYVDFDGWSYPIIEEE